MNAPASLARFAADAGLPRDADGPVFGAAWQAEALAMTVRLFEAGCFTWPEWAATLAAVLRDAPNEADDGTCYYRHWLTALERLVIAKSLLSAADLARRKAAWTEAYLATPHGRPVVLAPETATTDDVAPRT